MQFPLITGAWLKRTKGLINLLLVILFAGGLGFDLPAHSRAKNGDRPQRERKTTRRSDCGKRIFRCAIRSPFPDWTGNLPVPLSPRKTKLLESPRQITWRDTGSSSYEFQLENQEGAVILEQPLTENQLVLALDLEPGVYWISIRSETGNSRAEYQWVDISFEVVSSAERDRILTLLHSIADPWTQANVLAEQGYFQKALTLLDTLSTPESYIFRAEIYHDRALPEETLHYAERALLTEGLVSRDRDRAARLRHWAKITMNQGVSR
ncbi:MAG: hypothetical protein J7647_10795 [Cyanobacteria bacterium SBLK]|nr:hypothetical protein [Cyanobacteria bacterium SBLK]